MKDFNLITDWYQAKSENIIDPMLQDLCSAVCASATGQDIPYWHWIELRIIDMKSQLLDTILCQHNLFQTLTTYLPIVKSNITFQTLLELKSSIFRASHLLSRWFLAWLILRPWRWRRHVLPKRRLTFSGLYGVIYQKIELFIATAVRTSNPFLELSPSMSFMNQNVQFTSI
jgi:hypothetical protein